MTNVRFRSRQESKLAGRGILQDCRRLLRSGLTKLFTKKSETTPVKKNKNNSKKQKQKLWSFQIQKVSFFLFGNRCYDPQQCEICPVSGAPHCPHRPAPLVLCRRKSSPAQGLGLRGTVGCCSICCYMTSMSGCESCAYHIL